MIIDFTKANAANNVKFDDVVISDEWELDCSCHEFDYDFPVCNHTKGISFENIGYTQGYMNYGVPFEAEIFTDNDNEITLGVILPVLEAIEGKGNSRRNQKSVANAKGNILGMVKNTEHYNNSVLPLGMAIDGENDDLNITIAYVDFLISMGIVEFKSEIQNGSVLYFTDIKGNSLVQILVTLKENGEINATTPLRFKNFITGCAIPKGNSKNLASEERIEDNDEPGKKIYSEEEMELWPDDGDAEEVKEFFEHKEKDYKVVYENIDNRTVTKIKPYQLYGYMYAEGGAMGEGGRIMLFCFYLNEIHVKDGNYVYGPTDLNKVAKILPKFSDEKTMHEIGWTHIYMGCGNSLYVRKELEKDILDNVKYDIYPEFIDLVVNAIRKNR